MISRKRMHLHFTLSGSAVLVLLTVLASVVVLIFLLFPGLPPRSQPGSAGGSVEALDAQTGTGAQRRGGPSQRWPGAPVLPHEPQSPLEKQVTLPFQAIKSAPPHILTAHLDAFVLSHHHRGGNA